jgi:hypothetical protein
MDELKQQPWTHVHKLNDRDAGDLPPTRSLRDVHHRSEREGLAGLVCSNRRAASMSDVFGFTVANEVRITSVASMVLGLLPSPPSHSLFD